MLSGLLPAAQGETVELTYRTAITLAMADALGSDPATVLLGAEQPGVLDGDPGLVGNSLHQRQVILGEMVDLRVDDGEDTDDALARQQGDANGRARIAITAGYRPPQPARIVAGVPHQRRLTAFHDPAGQAPLVGIGQLFGRVIVDLTAERQGAFLHRPALVEDQDAPARRPDRLQRQLHDVLQQTPQIELRRQLPADVVEKLQR